MWQQGNNYSSAVMQPGNYQPFAYGSHGSLRPQQNNQGYTPQQSQWGQWPTQVSSANSTHGEQEFRRLSYPAATPSTNNQPYQMPYQTRRVQGNMSSYNSDGQKEYGQDRNNHGYRMTPSTAYYGLPRQSSMYGTPSMNGTGTSLTRTASGFPVSPAVESEHTEFSNAGVETQTVRESPSSALQRMNSGYGAGRGAGLQRISSGYGQYPGYDNYASLSRHNSMGGSAYGSSYGPFAMNGGGLNRSGSASGMSSYGTLYNMSQAAGSFRRQDSFSSVSVQPSYGAIPIGGSSYAGMQSSRADADGGFGSFYGSNAAASSNYALQSYGSTVGTTEAVDTAANDDMYGAGVGASGIDQDADVGAATNFEPQAAQPEVTQAASTTGYSADMESRGTDYSQADVRPVYTPMTTAWGTGYGGVPANQQLQRRSSAPVQTSVAAWAQFRKTRPSSSDMTTNNRQAAQFTPPSDTEYNSRRRNRVVGFNVEDSPRLSRRSRSGSRRPSALSTQVM